MSITHCRLTKNPNKAIRVFVLEVTARSAANILGIQPNTAALFYRKIRQVIAFNLAKEAHEIFQGDT